MITIQTKHVKQIGLLYLGIPVLLFLLGWFNYYVSIPLSALIVYVLWKAYRDMEGKALTVSRGRLIGILAVLFIWVVLSGIGRYSWQNLDHLWRNAIFNDLVTKDWPVSGSQYTLCYYIGFWLPAAGIGKLFGSMAVADCALQVWTFIGMCLFYFLVCDYMGKIRMGILILMIFFSGLDIIFYSIDFLKKMGGMKQLALSFTYFPHMEWCTGFFQASSITTMLYWVFNQAVPFFVGVMLMLTTRNTKYLFFTCSLLLIFSPLPFLGFAPVVAYFYIRELREKKFLPFLKDFVTSIPNITALAFIIVMGMYYSMNISSGTSGIKPPDIRYVYFLISQYFIFVIFLPKASWKDPVFVILLIVASLFPLIRLGESGDFGMRTNLAFIIYLMLEVGKRLYDPATSVKVKKGLIAVLAVGALTPLSEIGRSIQLSYIHMRKGIDLEQKISDEDSIFDNKLIGGNFIGEKENPVSRYLLRK